MHRQIRNRPSLLARLTAALSVALVLILTVLSSSPELHERLHGHHPEAAGAAQHDGIPANGAKTDNDDGCVVTLFAQGVVLALALLALAFTGQTLRSEVFAVFDRVIPESPRYLHLPTQAPPLV
jgi:hypothetical protein